MNTVTLTGIIMMLIIVLLLARSTPMIPVFILVPLVSLLILGYAPSQFGDVITGTVSSSLTGIGLLLMFSITFFGTISETGLFDRMVDFIVKKVRGNVYLVFIATIAVATIGHLDGSLVTTYLVAIPPLVPLYDRMKIEKKYLLFFTMMVTCSFIPQWSGFLLQTAGMVSLDPIELQHALSPVMIINYGLTFFCCFWFGKKHIKANGNTFIENDMLVENAGEEKASDPSVRTDMKRPDLLWVNAILVLACILCVSRSGMPAYISFMIFFGLALVINYHKNAQVNYIIRKYSASYFNPIMLIVSINILVGIMRETGMSAGMAEFMISLLPSALMRYAYVIVALLIVPVAHFIPYQVLMALYPFLIAIGESFGISPITVMIPFATNIIFGTGCSRYVAQTHLGIGLITGPKEDSDMVLNEYVKFAFPVCLILNAVSIAIAVVCGIY